MTNPTVQTLGPVDPNAPVAQKFYTVMTGLLGIVGIAATFGLVTQDQAASIGGVAAAAGSLLGAGATLVASFRTRKQINNGTFAAAPDPIVITQSPLGSAADAVTELKNHLDTAVADSVTKVQDAVSVIQGAVSTLPGAGGLVQAVTSEAADLVGDFLRSDSSKS